MSLLKHNKRLDLWVTMIWLGCIWVWSGVSTGCGRCATCHLMSFEVSVGFWGSIRVWECLGFSGGASDIPICEILKCDLKTPCLTNWQMGKRCRGPAIHFTQCLGLNSDGISFTHHFSPLSTPMNFFAAIPDSLAPVFVTHTNLGSKWWKRALDAV